LKILFITDNFPPEVNAPATRTYEHCKIWAQNGYDVTVITCVPNFPKGIVFKGYKNKLYQKEIIDGIKVIRAWSYITANSGFFRRIIDYISFSITATIVGIFQKADVIIATSPQFFSAIAGNNISFFKMKPWIFEVRDIWPESIIAVDGGLRQNSFIYKILEFIEKRLYSRAKLIVVVTDAFKNKLVERGIKQEKIEVFTNGSNMQLFYQRNKNQQIINKLKINNKIIFAYIGTIGLAHGIDFIVETFSKLNNPDFHLLILGEGAKKKEVLIQIQHLFKDNITFLDFVPKEDVPEYISIVDFAIVNLRRAPTFTSVIPSKIFEFAAMEKPILLGVDGQAREIIEKYNCGLFYEPENRQDLLDKIEIISSDINLKNSLIEGCRKLAMEFNRDKIAISMIESIKMKIGK
jgi:glycosyltransferase involved in cell wall biosynthesis